MRSKHLAELYGYFLFVSASDYNYVSDFDCDFEGKAKDLPSVLSGIIIQILDIFFPHLFCVMAAIVLSLLQIGIYIVDSILYLFWEIEFVQLIPCWNIIVLPSNLH